MPDALELAPDPPSRPVVSTRIVAVRGTEIEIRADRVLAEGPLEIRVAGPGQDPLTVGVTMRTLGDDAELAVGWLRTQGVIGNDDIVRVQLTDPPEAADRERVIVVSVRDRVEASELDARTAATAGLRSEPLPGGPVVGRTVILGLPAALRAERAIDEPELLEAAALFTSTGEPVAMREDLGLPAALDRLVGSQLLAGRFPLHERLLAVSRGVSFEIVRKAAVAGIPIVASAGAPTSLAIEAAERLGVTLLGRVHGDGFDVYANDGRVDLSDLIGA
jgi:FdhD protein